MALEDSIDVVITRESATLSFLGANTPLVLALSTEVPVAFTERLRYYTNVADMITDGFDATDETYLEVAAILSQSPRPPRVAVGRRATAVAQVTTITPTPVNDATYTITQIFDGDAVYGPFAYVADASATATEISGGLLALINATAIKVTASGTTTLILTADVAGVPFTVTESDANLAVAATTPSVGITEDLAAIVDEQPDWYGLILTSHDAGNILAAAAAVEAMDFRLLIAQSLQATITSAPYNVSTPYTDVASTIKSRGYLRTALAFHETATERLAAAWMGRCLAAGFPGSLTWKFKKLAGVTVQALTATERVNLTGKNGNSYETFAGQGSTFDGRVGEGEWIDVVHGLDALKTDIQRNLAFAALTQPKVPFTQKGINSLGACVSQSLALFSDRDHRFIADERVNAAGNTERPAYSVTPPLIGDIADADRQARTLENNPIVFEATLAGAVHKITVNGTVAA